MWHTPFLPAGNNYSSCGTASQAATTRSCAWTSAQALAYCHTPHLTFNPCSLNKGIHSRISDCPQQAVHRRQPPSILENRRKKKKFTYMRKGHSMLFALKVREYGLAVFTSKVRHRGDCFIKHKVVVPCSCRKREPQTCVRYYTRERGIQARLFPPLL